MDPIIGAAGAAYREIPLVAPGRIVGTVDIDGAIPEETVTRVMREQFVCGDSVVDESVPHRGTRIRGAVAWLTDARSGKPVPLRRRYEITNARCRLTPRVQAVLQGGTLNVRSEDPVEHRTRFTRVATGEPIATVRQYDEGQVVPQEDVLARSALVRASCELHQWTHGWVAVFDHPYFAVTDASGAFTIDSVPPGTYRLAIWQERFGKSERSITVPRGGQIAVAVKLGD